MKQNAIIVTSWLESFNNNINTHILIPQEEWLIRNIFGDSRELKISGNNRSICEVLGTSLACKYFHAACCTKATSSEFNGFIFQTSRWDPACEPRSESQAYWGSQCLHFTKKKGINAAYKSLHPRNTRRRRALWSIDCPNGIGCTGTRFIVGVDEVEASADGSNRVYGPVLTGKRVREVGPRSKSYKFALLLAIRGKHYYLIFCYSHWNILKPQEI